MTIFNDVKLERLSEAESEHTLFLGFYFPYGSEGSNTRQMFKKDSAFSGDTILGLKNKDNSVRRNQVINKLIPILTNLLTEGAILVVVPSSTSGPVTETRHGMTTLVKRLADSSGGRFIDGTDYLVRTETIPKSATGGNRAYALHFRTLQVPSDKVENIREKSILLLDDVTTTGQSMQASVDRLLAAGARDVRRLVLGLTINVDYEFEHSVDICAAQERLFELTNSYSWIVNNHRVATTAQINEKPAAILKPLPKPTSSTQASSSQEQTSSQSINAMIAIRQREERREQQAAINEQQKATDGSIAKNSPGV